MIGLDIPAGALAHLARQQVRRTPAPGSAFVALLGGPPKSRSRAPDRTRSKRCRAGARRTRRLAAAARRTGRPHPLRKRLPWAGWQDMGFVIIDETCHFHA